MGLIILSIRPGAGEFDLRRLAPALDRLVYDTLSLLQAATAGQWINLVFRPRRYQLTATSYRHARNNAFRLWADYAAKMAA